MLHMINKSPFQTQTLESCLEHTCEGSAILLLEDGIYGAMAGTTIAPKMAKALKTVPIYALGPDLEARGIGVDKIVEGIKVVDYAGFVDLTTQHKSVQSWL